MPIREEMKSLYPPRAEWKVIRLEVLERAGNRCEFPGCGTRNGVHGWRLPDGEFSPVEPVDTTGCRWIKIVLTIAHIDHDPTNNGTPGNRQNLRAWCQYHHLRHDHAEHQKNARATRARKKGQEGLPL